MKALKEGINIITNNVPRDIIYGFELPKKCRKEFDYMDDETFESESFFKYRNMYYAFSEFQRCSKDLKQKGWHGFLSDTYFSGVLIKLLKDQVIIGTFFCK